MAKIIGFYQGVELFCMGSNFPMMVKQYNLGTYRMTYFNFVIRSLFFNLAIILIRHWNEDYICTLELRYVLKFQINQSVTIVSCIFSNSY